MSDTVKAMEAELNHRASRRAAADARTEYKRDADGKFGSGGGSSNTEGGKGPMPKAGEKATMSGGYKITVVRHLRDGKTEVESEPGKRFKIRTEQLD